MSPADERSTRCRNRPDPALAPHARRRNARNRIVPIRFPSTAAIPWRPQPCPNPYAAPHRHPAGRHCHRSGRCREHRHHARDQARTSPVRRRTRQAPGGRHEDDRESPCRRPPPSALPCMRRTRPRQAPPDRPPPWPDGNRMSTWYRHPDGPSHEPWNVHCRNHNRIQLPWSLSPLCLSSIGCSRRERCRLCRGECAWRLPAWPTHGRNAPHRSLRIPAP